MSVKFVRSPNRPLLIGAGIALLLLATFSAGGAAARHFPVPIVVMSGTRDAVLGAALLFVAVRRSQFAGATAVIVAALLTFSVALTALTSLVFASVHLSWWVTVDLAIAAVVISPFLFPWSRTANKPVLFWIAATIAAMTLLIGALALLARL